MEKLCVFCDHFGWNNVEYVDYGGETGGGLEGGGVTCNKGMIRPLMWVSSRWERNEPEPDHNYEYLPDDAGSFRKVLLIASKCPHYLPPKQSELR